MNLHTAYCLRSGQVRITARKVPDGAMPLVTAKSYQRLRRAVDGVARLAYDNRTRLVPGIPEADDDEAALKAAMRFSQNLLKRLER